VEAGPLRVRYDLRGPAAAPVVVLSHSLGTDLSMWDVQAAALASRYRVLRYDARGHGRTTVAPGPYSVAELAQDVVRLLDALDLARAHFCGISMGGLFGMWLGAHASSRIQSLTLCNTAARIGSAETWEARIKAVREGGMGAVAAAITERWFTPAFRERSPEVVAAARTLLEGTPAEGYVATCAALRDADERSDLAKITCPTLIVAGRHDPATSPAEGRAVADAIRGARYVELEASHLSNLEAPSDFTSALSGFLAQAGSA
jgi:3-oxoadipate enol-lactonase